MTSWKSIARCFALVLVGSLAGGCVVHEHRVGTGPAGVGTTSVKQAYAFFGLIQLNDVDTQRFAEDAVSYDIRTEFSITDWLITLGSGFLVTTRTVTVDR